MIFPSKTVVLAVAAALLPATGVRAGGERDAFAEGVRLLREGKSVKAFAKLKEAEKGYGKENLPPALLADLALAAWQSGKAGEAESYAERAAARASGLTFVRDMVIGAARLAEANEAKTQGGPAVANGLEKVARAISAFERAVRARPFSVEARHNLERSLRLERELEKLSQQQKKDKENKKQGDQQQDEKKENQQDRQQQQGQSEQQQDEGQQAGQKKEEQKNDQQQQEQQQPQQQEQKSQGDEDGKQSVPRELTPEQKARLMRELEAKLEELRQLKRMRVPRHQPGKRDW